MADKNKKEETERKEDGKFEHLLPGVRKWLPLSIPERIRLTKRDVFVPYPLAVQALDYMNDLIDSPINDRPENVMLTGMPGSGKTSILSRWERLQTPAASLPPESLLVTSMPGGGKTTLVQQAISGVIVDQTAPVVIRPVVRITVPPGGKSDLITELLGALGYDTQIRSASTDIRAARVCNALNLCGTKVIILDDINNLKETATGKLSHATWETLKFIRFLSDKLRIHMIYTGDETSAAIIGQEASLRTRMNTVELAPWRNNIETAKLLRGVEATLPLAEPSNLGERARTSLIFSLGKEADRDGREGRLLYLVKIPKKAAQFALAAKREHIEDEDLEKAAEWYGRVRRTR